MVRASLLFATLFLFACSDESSGLDATPADSGAPDRVGADAASGDAEAADADPMDAASTDAEPMDTGPSDAESMDAAPTDAEPDAGSRDCAAIQAEYDALVTSTACEEAAQCQIVDGHCAVGLGGCWYTVNVNVMQGELDALAAEYVALGCTTGVCRCLPPPASAACDQAMCVPGP